MIMNSLNYGGRCIKNSRLVSSFNFKNATQKRYLSIHEYLSMDLLRRYDVKVPFGLVASTREEVTTISHEYFKNDTKRKELVIKAQVLAGGRGKGHFDNGFQGGVHVVSNPDDAEKVADKMLGHRLITKQTGAHGRVCDKVYIVEKVSPKHEFYFAILLDRKTKSPILIGSKYGGMDIEAVASKDPSAIISFPIDIDLGLTDTDAENFVRKIGISTLAVPKAANIIKAIYKLFVEKDVLLAEINPMAELEHGEVACLDAKFNFDDNADFRQPDIARLRDVKQEDEREIMASEYKLNYIGLDGTIGCLVNGAGLAMATMDIIKLHGGEPANFLDVGGSATAQQVCEAFKILSSDPRVNAILVNIFGGIMRCDIIAEGIIQAASKLDLQIPLIVRLQGTRVKEAKELIAKSGMKIFACDDLTDAAIKSVSLSQILSWAKKGHIKVAFPLENPHVEETQELIE